MKITLLTVPGCPHGELAHERIAAALEGREAETEWVQVRDEAEAASCGMTGSPTILVDGVDPFAVEGARPSLSCRLYRAADGTVQGAPTVAELRAALSGGCECCDGGMAAALALVGRGGRGRRAPAERGLLEMHQAVLRHFATTGEAPDLQVLAGTAAAHGRTARDVLAELAREDFLTLDADGAIRAAYPFSATPTPHRVRIGAVQVWSMCAIDALGITAMLGEDMTITSTDPVNGQAVTVSSTRGTLTWEPQGAVVFAGAGSGEGPAEVTCCATLNFFTGPDTAHAWSAAHPEAPGQILGRAHAERVAADIFGPLLETGEPDGQRP